MLLTSLFGAGCVGLRALATGIPASLLLDPRRAEADSPCPAGANPQFVIFSTSGSGDPINANAPGTYDDPKIVHCPTFTPTKGTALPTTATITLGSKTYTAGGPWAMTNLDPTRTAVFHLMTNTPVHPKEPDVLRLMGGIAPAEMLPSLLAGNLQACLGTLQAQPITVGAASPSEALTFQGGALPIIPPLALKATLANPGGILGNLQKVRADTLKSFGDVYLKGASQAQQNFFAALINSQAEIQNINQQLLGNLDSITDNSPGSQILAALTLIQMKVSAVVAIHIPFGGDNHHDTGLTQFEGPQTADGFATLDNLLGQLKTAKFSDGSSLADKVSVVSLNVFGRTIGQGNTDGRQHNPNHQVSFAIGKPFKGGMYGAVTPVMNDYGAMPINSMTGAGDTTGDIKPIDTLTSFGITVATAAGVDPKAISYATDPTRTANGAGTQKLISGALA
jgi:hypothetical protein